MNDAAQLSAEFDKIVQELIRVVRNGAHAASASRQERLIDRVNDMVTDLRRCAERPDEPIDCDVVRFTRRWDDRQRYTYAAVKATNSFWYVTSSDLRYSWDQLLDFIGDANHASIVYLTGATTDDSDADR